MEILKLLILIHHNTSFKLLYQFKTNSEIRCIDISNNGKFIICKHVKFGKIIEK